MKRKRIIAIILVSVIVVAGGTAGILYSQGFFGKSSSSSTTSYTVDKLTTGDIEKSITGTGTLSAGSSATLTVPVDLKINTVAVKVGQNVKAGDTIATIDAASLADTIDSLQSEITTLDSSIARQTSSEESVQKLTSQVSGRVKKLLCAVGDDVDQKMTSAGGLFLLSTDGKMNIQFSLAKAKATTVGTKVKVTTGGTTYTGLVESLSSDGKTCTVTLTDNGTALGASATVATTDGAKLGSGKLAINRPYLVPATAGTISKIYVDVNDSVSSRTSLAYLTGIPTSDTYNSLIKSRADKAAMLQTALKLQKAGCLTAEKDGTIKTLSVSAGQIVKADDTLVTMMTLDSVQLDVSIDELDINNVSVGQAASIAIDAVTSKTFDGTVKSISQIGTTSNGVTTYDVTIDVPSASTLKVGMNATATIIIEKHSGVLLMPIEALNTIRGKSYVWLYTGTLPTDGTSNPGTRTEVTTGLSNSNNVEITAGLTASDQVVVVRSKATSGSNSSRQNGMFGMGGMGGGMGGEMPGGGNPPSGGFPGSNR